MKVRVKAGKKGFIYGSLRKEGAEFTLKSFNHPRKVDDKGAPLVVTAEQQFSNNWMEKIAPAKKPSSK